ncbi:MAG: 3-methyl-2-oxobutanoate dehydrogenase subunit VorB [Nanoarchaeota archaeon]|nr:3-methyl-2-oxobutanoate dehydrogenase subunit VorB [Nanoarchaeota archaeon]
MTEKILMKGNEAMSAAAVKAGCKFYAGYPITPQNEVTQYLSRELPKVGSVFIQAESELAAINMVFGASSTGARAMTSSSSPGISLKQEGISYIAAAELPCVIVNVMRGGPGLGNIMGSQGDYFQATKGGGHGDYRLIVLAPSSVQETYNLTIMAFDLADKYRNPVMILTDGVLAQMAEAIELKEPPSHHNLPRKDWALTGCKGRKPNVIKTLHLYPADALEKVNIMLDRKYKKIEDELQKCEKINCDDADIVVIAYGLPSRIGKSAIKKARLDGIKAGLLRPITLWPFPKKEIQEISKKCKKFLVVEMSNGQMIEDVKLALYENGNEIDISFLGRGGGWYPKPEEVLNKIKEVIGNGKQ